MFRRMYIIHDDTLDGNNGIAFFGPFKRRELQVRLNDSFANGLASIGGDVYARSMSRREAKRFYVNPREFWMEQVKDDEIA